MTKKRYIFIPLVVLSIGVLIAGAIGYTVLSRGSGSDEVVFKATERGTPIGDRVTKEIGPAGGTLVSPDGRLTLKVTQNAVSAPATFSIQPITNQTENAFGGAYRLEPKGQQFSTPVELTLKYDDQDPDFSDASLLVVVYQDNGGGWRGLKTSSVDAVAKTTTVMTTHFTDFGYKNLIDMKLPKKIKPFPVTPRLHVVPERATVHVGESVAIDVVGCDHANAAARFLRETISGHKEEDWCYTGTDWDATLAFAIEKKNGHLPWGHLSTNSGEHTIYTAPSHRPTPNTETVRCGGQFYSGATGFLGGGGTNEGALVGVTEITILARGYRASGQDGPTTYSGVVCSLDEPFTITGNNSLVPYPLKFVPTSGTAGTLSYSATWKLLTMAGEGTYTIEGADTDKPRIIAQTRSTLTAMGHQSSGGGPAHIDLTPLETNECDRQNNLVGMLR